MAQLRRDGVVRNSVNRGQRVDRLAAKICFKAALAAGLRLKLSSLSWDLVLRRNDQFVSDRVTHTENTLWRRIRRDVEARHHPAPKGLSASTLFQKYTQAIPPVHTKIIGGRLSG
jgi:hypothetical protein